MLNATNTSGDVAGSSTMTAEMVLYILLSLWIIVANSILALSVLLSSQRRSTPFNLHIVNLAIAHLLIGILVLPLLVEYLYRGLWQFDEDICLFWLIADDVLHAAAILAIFMVNLNRFLHASVRKLSTGSVRHIVCFLMMAVVWVGAILLVVPLVVTHMDGWYIESGKCNLSLPNFSHIIYLVTTYFALAVFVVALNFAVITLYCVLPGSFSRAPDKRRHSRWQVAATSLVTATMVALTAPVNVIVVLSKGMAAESSWQFLRGPGFSIAQFLAHLSAGVAPVLWLVSPGVRQAVKDLFCCKMNSRQREFPIDDTHAKMIMEPSAREEAVAPGGAAAEPFELRDS